MNPIASALLESGAIPASKLLELHKFLPGVFARAQEEGAPADLGTVVQLVKEAFESERVVLVRETDLDIVRAYTRTACPGVLYVAATEEERPTRVPLTFGRTALGEYILPTTDALELLDNGVTYLQAGPSRTSAHVRFRDAKELFFGHARSFVVCSPVAP